MFCTFQIHVNPLYYKIKDTVPLKILNKGNDISLCVGDTFGLLPDLFWFKIQAEQMPTDSLPTSNSQDENTEEIGEIVDNLPQNTSSQNETLPARGIESANNMDGSEEQNGDSGTGTKRKLPAWMTDSGNKKRKAADSAVDACENSNVEGGSRNSPPSENNETKDEDMTVDVSNQLENTSMDGPTSSSVSNSINEHIHEAEPAPQMNAIEVEMAVPEVAQNVIDSVSGNTIEIPVRVKQEPTDEVLSSIQIKTEVKDDPDANEPSTSTSKDDSTQTDDQKVKIKREKDDCGNVVSSTSASTRESCRYGVRCYRYVKVWSGYAFSGVLFIFMF